LAGSGGDEALEESSDTSFTGDDGNCVKESSHSRVGTLAVVDSIAVRYQTVAEMLGIAYNVVLILSNGVTASKLSVTPAPNPAMTVLGPEIFPSASCNRALY
jgi:hypothetical protein